MRFLAPPMRMINCSIVLIFLAFSTTYSAGYAAPLDADKYPAPGTHIWLGDYRMHLHCQGRGSPTVILEAGLGGTSLEWVRVQPKISRFTRVCSYDRYGYGWSDPSFEARTAATIVTELRQLMGNGAVAAPYLLVGHSFGGLTMRLFASRYPQYIAGMVLLDPTHEAQFDQQQLASPSHKTLIPNQNKAFVIGNHYQIPTALPAEIRPTAQMLALIPSSIRSLYSELRYIRISAAQVRQSGQTLPDVPLTIIAHNSLIRAQTAKAKRFAGNWLTLQRELATRAPQGRFIMAEHSGHHIHLEQPELVINSVRDIVEQNRRTE